MKLIGKLTLAVLVTSCVQSTGAFGQEMIERTVVKRVPPVLMENQRVQRIIERQVIHDPGIFIQSDADLVKRSNYVKRLSDMQEQISNARANGWLTDAQFKDLSDWHASVAKEELAMRESGYGRVPASDVDQMEKHMTGLEYAINKNIDANKK